MAKRFRYVIGALVLFCLVFPFQMAAGKSYQAERFDSDVVIEEGGTLLVTETIVFQFSGGPYTYAFRQLDRSETDRIDILSAAMDGVELPRGMQAGQVEISSASDPIDVRWHFAPTTDQSRTFTLKYRVSGTTRVAGNTDQVKWYLIPGDHEYKIQSSTMMIHLPAGRTLAGAAGLTGAAWNEEATPDSLIFTAQDIPANRAAILTLSFPGGSLLTHPPAWQAVQLERARQTRAAFPWAAGVGLACLILGSLGLTRFWWNNHPVRSETFEQGIITRPPNELSPAEAGALFSLPNVPLELAVATLLDLARRGWVRMEQIGHKGFLTRQVFLIVREPVVNDIPLRPHEQTAYDLVFDRQPGSSQISDSVELPKAIERLQRGLRLFSETVIETMLNGQWMDPVRRQKRRRITSWSMIGMLLSILVFFISLFMIGAVSENRAFVGMLLMGFSIALFVLSIACLSMASSWFVLTERGLRARKQWWAFADYLKGQVRSQVSILQEEWLNDYLPFAAAFHIGDRWARAFQDRGLQPQLAWLRAADDMQAANVVALMAGISASSDSASGASGGGGGGGASGAG